MEYIKKEYAAYNVHLIKTSRFKTTTIEVNFLRKIKKEEITIRNFLSEILLQSTKQYPTKRLLTLKSMELYNANISSSNSRIGNFENLSFSLKFLDEKYTEEGMFNKTLDFFFDTLFNPNVENEGNSISGGLENAADNVGDGAKDIVDGATNAAKDAVGGVKNAVDSVTTGDAK